MGMSSNLIALTTTTMTTTTTTTATTTYNGKRSEGCGSTTTPMEHHPYSQPQYHHQQPSYRRNSSMALALHSNLLNFQGNNNSSNEVSPFHVVGSARRRLSNVSDVVSRKISHTIGWRTVSASVELTVSQVKHIWTVYFESGGSSLCAQYLRNRLKRSGIFHRKLGLKRMRSAIMLPGGSLVGEVSPELISVGSELEKMHPNLFLRIARQIGYSTFSSEQSANGAFIDISREMLRNGEMTWGKVVALYAIAGGIAVDCVRQGNPEYLLAVQRAMNDILEEDLATWIQANGGWGALTTRYRPAPKPRPFPRRKLILMLLILAFVLILTVFVVVRVI